MASVIGREEEQHVLEAAYESQEPHFIALYGRRRVGKTFLVRNTFKNRKNGLFFEVTGIKDGPLLEQLTSFTEAIGRTFDVPVGGLKIQESWRDAFNLLTEYINKSDNKKIVLFFDEFPWMVTKNSRLLRMLQYFWNQHWSQDGRIKLVICGSSAGWILKKIINNRGGLYNRVTRRIHLEPFNLAQARQFLKHQKIDLTNRQITDLYMVLGGIPFYLSQIERGETAVQAIERLAFKKSNFLMSEFDNLYATLFDSGGGHVELARIIAQHHYGIGQEELVKEVESLGDDVSFSSGGTLVSVLKDLEAAGFIQRFLPFQHTRRGIYYKMIDEYSIFYFHWIEPIKSTLLGKGMRMGYWEKAQHSPAWRSWAGYAFESICYKHISQISIALKLSPSAVPYAWRFVPEKGSQQPGAQVDLLFDREDGAITLCEIKYSLNKFAIDKDYAEKLNHRMDVFKKRTKTKKQLFLSFISASGLTRSIYSEAMVSGVVVLDDLFKKDE